MKFPTIENIISLHRMNLEQTGGEDGILHREQLDDFIEQAKLFSYYNEFDLISTASWLLTRMIQNHYFVDGNKRTALTTMLVFLKINNLSLKENVSDQLFQLTMDIASSEISDFETVKDLVSTLIEN